MGMLLLKGNEKPQDIIYLAYGLEAGLENFYEAAAKLAIAEEVVGVLAKLAAIEVRHKQKLFDLYQSINPGATTLASFESTVNADYLFFKICPSQ